MFNLTVSEAHTFYVGNDGWLVHNGKKVPLPPGMTNEKLGEMIGWGRNQDGGFAASEKKSLERMANLTDDELKAFYKQGLTSDMAEEWSKIYTDVHAKNPSNLTAKGRAPLMQSIADRMRQLRLGC